MSWWTRKQHEQDLERELRSDLELEAAEQQESGLSAEKTRGLPHCGHSAIRLWCRRTSAQRGAGRL